MRRNLILCLVSLLVPLSARGAEHLRAPYLVFQVGFEQACCVEPPNSLGPSDVAAGDLNGDGRADLAVVNRDGPGIEGGSVLSILMSDPNPTLPLLASQVRYATSFGPARVAMGDLDQDGDLDVVTADGGSDSITVFLNRGDGALGAGKRAPLGSEPLSLVLADLNLDGRKDLVLATNAGIKVLLASGPAGSFTAPVTYAVSGTAQAMAVGAVDADGIPDLVAATSSPNALAILHGVGNGTFVPAGSAAIPYLPSALELADMTGNGTPDAVVGCGSSARLLVRANDGGPPFASSTADVTVPGSPLDIVVRDLNGDGALDVAAALHGGSALQTGEVLLGNGGGGFFSAYSFDFGTYIEAIAAGDLNGDGRPDLAACGAGQIVDAKFQRAVHVVLQPASGGFGIATAYRTPAYDVNACGAIAADMDRDGKDDLVIAGATATQASVTIRPGLGNGTWDPGFEFVVPGNLVPRVVPGDFSRDGRMDLVVSRHTAAQPPSTMTYLGNGNGTITPLGTWSASVEALAAGDFDRDGRLDLVAADPATKQLMIHRGHGDGSFFVVWSSVAFAQVPTEAAVGDVNRDGRLDLVVAAGSEFVLLGNGDGTMGTSTTIAAAGMHPVLADLDGDANLDLVDGSPRRGNGDGTFQSSVPLPASALQPGPFSPAVALDVNRDGRLDLIEDVYEPFSSNVMDTRLDVWLGNSGGFGFGARTGYGVARHARGLLAVDADRDGRGDVVAIDEDPSGSPWLLTLLGNGPESFPFPTSRPVSPLPTAPLAMAMADFTQDGIADLVVARADAGGDYATLMIGNGNGTFTPSISNLVPPEPVAMATGDLNRDGIPDLAIACGVGDAVVVQLATPYDTLSMPLTVAAGLGYEFSDIAIGDFNRDGKPDLAAASAGSSSILIFPGHGNGEFGAPIPASTGSDGPTSIAVGDINRDGIPDLVAALGVGINPSSVATLLGIGDGTFQTDRPYPCGASPHALTLADLNRDGLLDVAVTRTGTVGSRYVALLFGAGSGFGSPVAYPITGNATDIVAADIDGEGLLDLLAPNGFGYDSFSFLHNIGLGLFAANTDYFLGGSPYALATGDLNRDGRTDIAGTLAGEPKVVVVLSSPSTISDVPVASVQAPPRAPRLVVRPNPAAGRATLSFRLPASGRARVDLFDVRGRRVARLFDAPAEGEVTVRWDGTVLGGGRAAAGVYFATVTSAEAEVTRRIVWLR